MEQQKAVGEQGNSKLFSSLCGTLKFTKKYSLADYCDLLLFYDPSSGA